MAVPEVEFVPDGSEAGQSLVERLRDPGEVEATIRRSLIIRREGAPVSVVG